MQARSRTRKIKKLVIEEVKPSINKTEDIDIRWKKFVIECDLLFEYMTHNYDKILNEYTPNNFYICGGLRDVDNDTLFDTYGDDILNKLIPWIQQEYESGRLFDKSKWRPVRDDAAHTCMIGFGYRKMFVYNNYYLRLLIDSYRGDYTYSITNEKYPVQFDLALYGYKDLHTNRTVPIDHDIITDDGYLSDFYWNFK